MAAATLVQWRVSAEDPTAGDRKRHPECRVGVMPVQNVVHDRAVVEKGVVRGMGAQCKGQKQLPQDYQYKYCAGPVHKRLICLGKEPKPVEDVNKTKLLCRPKSLICESGQNKGKQEEEPPRKHHV